MTHAKRLAVGFCILTCMVGLSLILAAIMDFIMTDLNINPIVFYYGLGGLVCVGFICYALGMIFEEVALRRKDDSS